ncbi:MAG: triose-phosphate isomerase [Candidatus Competibacteraceae bacterium]|nr:triose-phosphate isomerase [Candidatus Competibacteraceae bacterium]MCB1805384.1 triose-phosphate isomerase [Candidatus Competibacteraceae bacterium]MCB1812671.1 triose-phosphate isomerase [Candidatus Competibacteraceae bacterium]
MRQYLVAGNWKMNGSLASVRELLAAISQSRSDTAELAVFPPFVYLAEAATQLQGSGVAWGAQNVSEHTVGAYTGEVAATMLQDFGCIYTLVGHSERRALYGETDAQTAVKFELLQQAGIRPVLCLGETLQEREAGQTERVVGRQLTAVLARVGVAALSNCVLAYEPVWAIGTGKTATPEQAQAVHAFIRSIVAKSDDIIAGSVRILYGGSVKSANARALFAMPDIDGGLIGGASLNPVEFLDIAHATI